VTTFVDHDDQKLPDGTLGRIRSFLSGPFKGRRYHMVVTNPPPSDDPGWVPLLPVRYKQGRRIIPDVKLAVVDGQPTLVATSPSGSSRLRRVGRVGASSGPPAPAPGSASAALRHEDPVPVPPARL